MAACHSHLTVASRVVVVAEQGTITSVILKAFACLKLDLITVNHSVPHWPTFNDVNVQWLPSRYGVHSSSSLA